MNFNYWVEPHDIRIRPYAYVPNSADIVIVGGGITGLLMAYILSITMNQYSVMVLDKTFPGTDSTSWINGMVDLKLTRKILKHPNFSYINQISQSGLETLKTIAKDLACDPDFSGSVHVAMSESELSLLKSVGEILDTKDVANVTPISDSKGGIFIPSEFTVNPFKFCQSLNEFLIKNGNFVVPGANVTQIEDNKVFCDNGHVVKCKYVILCDGGMKDHLKPTTFYTIFAEYDLPSLLPASYQFQNGYVHRHSNLLVMSHTGKNINSPWALNRSTIKEILKKIQSKVGKQVKSLKPLHVHASIVHETESELPLIKKISPYQYRCTGFNRSGLSLIPPIALIVSDLIQKDSIIDQNKIFFSDI